MPELSALSVILASASATRAALLAEAGLALRTNPAGIDENALKSALRANGTEAGDAALALAEAKALPVSVRHEGALVIGADQMLVLDRRWFDKPRSAAEAREHLLVLRGRRHELVTAVCVARDGAVLWRHVERPSLVMRAFSAAFLDAYLATIGDDVLTTVGGYRLEGRGVQLMARVDGDFFSILGLPLLPLLEFLRGHGAVPS